MVIANNSSNSDSSLFLLEIRGKDTRIGAEYGTCPAGNRITRSGKAGSGAGAYSIYAGANGLVSKGIKSESL